MSTTTTTSPDFLKFIGYLDFPITPLNLAFLTDLFVNFTQFPNGTNESLEVKFIKWERFYDASNNLSVNIEEENLMGYINTDAQEILQTFPPVVDVSPNLQHYSPSPPPAPPQTPTTPPLQLVDNIYRLPNDLIAIQNSAGCYKNFTLEVINDQTLAKNSTLEIMNEKTSEHIEQIYTTPPPPPQPKGKNIAKLMEIYNETQEEDITKKKNRHRNHGHENANMQKQKKQIRKQQIRSFCQHHHLFQARPSLVPEGLPKTKP
jgi:hypothetical protein